MNDVMMQMNQIYKYDEITPQQTQETINRLFVTLLSKSNSHLKQQPMTKVLYN